jgi:hypothetical protein
MDITKKLTNLVDITTKTNQSYGYNKPSMGNICKENKTRKAG